MRNLHIHLKVYKSFIVPLALFISACDGSSGGISSSSNSPQPSSSTSSSVNNLPSSAPISSASHSANSSIGEASSAATELLQLPGRIEAMAFSSFEDSTVTNSGDCGASAVDLQYSDSGGANCTVGWTTAGEWLAYNTTVNASGMYDFNFRVATNTSARALKMFIDGTSVGSIILSGTDWTVWNMRSIKNVPLTKGNHEIKFLWLDGSINLDYVDVSINNGAGTTSTLWGSNGESHDPSGYLTDFSYAGYHWGEEEPPFKAPTIYARNFGASAGDNNDDTSAIKSALNSAKYGDVVRLDAGRYIISNKIYVPNGVVLQGEGSRKTTIYIPKNLSDVSDADPSFDGAFINLTGSHDNGVKIASITAHAARGAKTVQLDRTPNVKVGDWIQIEQTDSSGRMVTETLYEGYSSGADAHTDLVGDKMMEFFSRVTAVNNNSISFERALPIAVDPANTAELHTTAVPYGEVGLEGIRVEFPATSYPGHFNELGYNAIQMEAQHSWIRDVTVINVDYGINIKESHFLSLLDITLFNENNRNGHHGISLGHSTDCLVRGFDLQSAILHDLTVEWYNHSNVFTQGRGRDLSLDHHKGAPYANLFTEIYLGESTRTWKSGGRDDRGYNTAAYSTLWNLSGAKGMPWPPKNYGPKMVFVGVNTSKPSSDLNWWYESMKPNEIFPPNIWIAQKQKRLAF